MTVCVLGSWKSPIHYIYIYIYTHQKIICFNSVQFAFREMSDLIERYQMDCRRLEEAHFQFAILQTASWYLQHMNIDKLALHGSTKSTLLDVVSMYMQSICK